MSHEATNWAYKLDLPMSQKFVLIALADRADEHHSCFPGQKSLATMVGSSVETVRRALIGLEHAGLIRRERRNRASGYRTSDRYVLSVGSLPVNLPTRQSAYKAESGSLPVNERNLTGQSEGANEPSGEPPGESSVKAPPKTAGASKPRTPTPEQIATDAAYERLDKGFDFIKVRQIVKWAIHEKNEDPQRVEEAIVGVHQLGKPITKQTMGQYLDGIIGGQQPRRGGTRDRMLNVLALADRYSSEQLEIGR